MTFISKVHSMHTVCYTICCSVFFWLVSTGIAFALDIQNLDYQVNDQIINHVSEHVISFDTVSPIAIGNSVSVNFPSEFSFTTTPVQSDVEVRVNGSLLTVSQWSFSHSLNTVFISFQTSASAGSDIEITLTESAGLKNPSDNGSYTVNFGVNGTFVATAEVWIFPSDSITVNAAVLGDPVVAGGGSSGGTCYNCFFNDEQPFFDENGIILSFKGFGPSNGTVQVSIDESLVGTTSIDDKGIFLISIDNISPGLHTFTFNGFDRNVVPTGPRLLTLTVGDRGFVYANDIFLSPTVTVEPRGDYGLVLYGYTVPYAELDLNIDGYYVGTVIANGNGLYFLETLLDQFDIGEHTVTSILKGLTRNLSSEEKVFTITPVFNSDEKQLEFVGDPLFDVLLRTPEKSSNERSDIVPYLFSFGGGALLLWLIVRLVGYIKGRGRYLSDYEK